MIDVTSVLAGKNIDVTIDVSEASVALSGVLGMMDAIGASGTPVMRRVEDKYTSEFGAYADLAGVEGGMLEHVYEYGMEGTKAGRLWVLNWDSVRGNVARGSFTFRPSQIQAPIDPRLVRHATLKRKPLAHHVWPDKAYILETMPTLTSMAGNNQHTIRTGGVSDPQYLVFWSERKGRPMFVKSMERENKYQGNFQTFVEGFFATGTVEEAFADEADEIGHDWQEVTAELQKMVNSTAKTFAVAAGQGAVIMSQGVVGGIRVVEKIRQNFRNKLKGRIGRK